MPAPRHAALPRAARLTLWANAWLSGATTLEDAGSRVVGRDAPHRVAGVPGEDAAVPVDLALARLRAAGMRAVRLVLPEPGDPLGLPGPPEVTARAVAAGQAVVTVGPPGERHWALVPAVSATDGVDVVRWDVSEVPYSPHPHGLPTLSEAERSLAESVAAATRTLADLDLAGGREEVADRLAALDREVARVDLPRSLPARAQRTVVQATRLVGILDLAGAHEGAAVTAGEAGARAAAIRPLRAVARHALCAACSAQAEPEPPRRAWRDAG